MGVLNSGAILFPCLGNFSCMSMGIPTVTVEVYSLFIRNRKQVSLKQQGEETSRW